jgi:hypothetical protein
MTPRNSVADCIVRSMRVYTWRARKTEVPLFCLLRCSNPEFLFGSVEPGRAAGNAHTGVLSHSKGLRDFRGIPGNADHGPLNAGAASDAAKCAH